MTENGQRLIVGKNGVFVQVKRAWLDCIEPIGQVAVELPLPYGIVRPKLSLTFGVIPMDLLAEFVEAGRAHLPNEVAGGLIYSASRNALRLAVYDSIQQTRANVDYRMPVLDGDEEIVVDLHTHGDDRAYFSPVDDEDDRSVKIAGVFGNLSADMPSAAFRLCINGYYRTLPFPA